MNSIYKKSERFLSQLLFAQIDMGRRPDLSQKTISRITTLYKAGCTVTQIVRATGVSLRSVERWVSKCREAPAGAEPTISKHTDKQKRNRVAFAKKYITWPMDKFRTILWSDESTFTISETPPASDCLTKKIKKIKHPTSVIVWGAFSYYGVSKLYFHESYITMNTDKYLKFLRDNLKDCFHSCRAQIFMANEAQIHSNTVVKQWINDCAVECIQDWPGNSPDLDLMESLWCLMKKKLQGMDTSSIHKLKDAIQSVWDNLSSDLLHNLADSFPTKLREVLARNGNTTMDCSVVSVCLLLFVIYNGV